MNKEEIYNQTSGKIERNTVLSTLKVEDIISYLSGKEKNVLEGNINGYEVYFNLSQLEKKIKEVKDSIKETVLDEVNEPFDWNGFNVKKISGSGRYDFSVCDGWNKKKNELKEIEAHMKTAFKKGQEYIDSETGEVYPVPEYKGYSDKIVFTKNKS
jgi:hypothetical protein